MKVLLIDDSKFSQILMTNLLKGFEKNIEIITANDGEEGFEKYKEVKPDYVFVDLLMPKLNGKELIALIKEYDQDSKIFVVSADVQKQVKEEMEAFGLMGFINKPLNEEKARYIYELIKGDKNEG